jgi:hypothetical protein
MRMSSKNLRERSHDTASPQMTVGSPQYSSVESGSGRRAEVEADVNQGGALGAHDGACAEERLDVDAEGWLLVDDAQGYATRALAPFPPG